MIKLLVSQYVFAIMGAGEILLADTSRSLVIITPLNSDFLFLHFVF